MPTPLDDAQRAVGPTVPSGTVTEERPPAASDSPRRARTRDRLVEAAWAVFAEHGLAGASVEAVVERAGFTRGAFYSNFSSKEELFLTVMARGREQWIARLVARADELLPSSDAPAVVPEDTVGPIVMELLGSPFDFRRDALMQAEFRLLALRDDDLARAYVADRDAFEESLVPLVTDILQRGGRRALLDARSLVRLLAALHKETVVDALLSGSDEAQAAAAGHAAVVEVLPLLITPPAA